MTTNFLHVTKRRSSRRRCRALIAWPRADQLLVSEAKLVISQSALVRQIRPMFGEQRRGTLSAEGGG